MQVEGTKKVNIPPRKSQIMPPENDEENPLARDIAQDIRSNAQDEGGYKEVKAAYQALKEKYAKLAPKNLDNEQLTQALKKETEALRKAVVGFRKGIPGADSNTHWNVNNNNIEELLANKNNPLWREVRTELLNDLRDDLRDARVKKAIPVVEANQDDKAIIQALTSQNTDRYKSLAEEEAFKKQHTEIDWEKDPAQQLKGDALSEWKRIEANIEQNAEKIVATQQQLMDAVTKQNKKGALGATYSDAEIARVVAIIEGKAAAMGKALSKPAPSNEQGKPTYEQPLAPLQTPAPKPGSKER